MTVLPAGTVTFLFTDIEGSTRLLRELGDRYPEVLEGHRHILRSAIQKYDGKEFGTEGDSLFVAFERATDAIKAAREAQLALAAAAWPEGGRVKVRIGIHTGEPALVEHNYVGLDVHRASRICAAGHGGQVLISGPTRSLVTDEVSIVDLGVHRLKDLPQPEQLYQLVVPGLQNDFPPPVTLETPTNLPGQPTRLIDREEELESVQEFLTRAEGPRIVTLTGPGGTGKTRLALRVGEELLEKFPNGVFFVGLASIRDPELVPPTIAHALDITYTGARPVLDELMDELRGKQVLLILDNFEQVVASAPLLAQLVDVCPRLKLLVTSRVLLSLRAECEFAVSPLEVPDVRHAATVEELSQYAAMRLFIDRAVAAKRDFTVDNSNAPAIAEICYRLEGLPLAIELAAARVRLLSPNAILARLDDKLKLLTGGPRDLPDRQRTLRNAIEWSFGLLTDDEKDLFTRLAVFRSSVEIDTIDEVCNGEGRLDVLEVLSSLRDQSLIRQVADDEPRFGMLATIREYAVERLQAIPQLEDLRRRHAHHYAALAEAADKELQGPDQLEWRNKLESEIDDLRAALEWSLEGGADAAIERKELALRLTGALAWFWYAHSRAVEGSRWLEAALAATDDFPTASRAKPLHAAGVLASSRGDSEKATGFLHRALACARELGDTAQMASSMNSLAVDRRAQGQISEARSLLEQSLELRRSMGDRRGLATTLSNLGILLMDEQDLEGAEASLQEALDIDRELGNLWGQAVELANLAMAALERGDVARAGPLLHDALQGFVELGDKDGAADTLETFASAAALERNWERAVRLSGAAEALREELSVPMMPVDRARLERYLAPARRELGEDAFRSILADGRKMTFEQACDYALAPLAPFAETGTKATS